MTRLAVVAGGLLAVFMAAPAAAEIAITQATTTTLCENFQPAISGAGNRIVFLADCEIIPGRNTDQNYEVFLYDIEARRFTQVTDTTGRYRNNGPAINHDGARVVFSSSADLLPGQNADGNVEIFLFDAAADRLTQLTRTAPPAANNAPSIDGAGRAVVFLSTGDLVKGQNRDGSTEVFSLDLPGGKAAQLTRIDAPPPAEPRPLPIAAASITRDGSGVIIESSAELVRGRNRERVPQIFRYDRTKKAMRQLTDRTHAHGAEHRHGAPAASDDGRRLALVVDGEDGAPSPTGGRTVPAQRILAVLDTGTGETTRLLSASDCKIDDPSVNGDATVVVFASTCDFVGTNQDRGQPNLEVFVYRSATGSVTQLTHTIRDFNHTPSIDRSGRRIAFGSDRDIHRGGNLDENSEIFLAVLDE
jgi:Tol biopolymer transport system component